MNAGILGIWHDIHPQHEGWLDEWFVQQELPRTVGHAGVRSLRRYVALSDGPRYLTLYEFASAARPAMSAYLERLRKLTAPGRRSRGINQSLAAIGGPVQLQHACAVGGVAMSINAEPAAGGGSDDDAWLAEVLEREILPLAGVLGIRLWRDCGLAAGSADDGAGGGRLAALVEGASPGALAAALRYCTTALGRRDAGTQWRCTAYRLIHFSGSTEPCPTPPDGVPAIDEISPVGRRASVRSHQ